MNSKTWIVCGLVVIALIGAYFWLNRPERAAQLGTPIDIKGMTQEVLRAGWPGLLAAACRPAAGSAKAPWTMIEIGDFQCPQCGRARTTVDDIVENSNGQVKLYFVNWPLPRHKNAPVAAAAGLAAGAQGKFWRMYEAVYANQDPLDKDSAAADAVLLSDAHSIGLNIARFNGDRNSPATKQRIATQTKAVEAIKAELTPTFLLRRAGDPTIYWFVGLDGQAPSRTTPQYYGLELLEVAAPWGGSILPPPPYAIQSGRATSAPQPVATTSTAPAPTARDAMGNSHAGPPLPAGAGH